LQHLLENAVQFVRQEYVALAMRCGLRHGTLLLVRWDQRIKSAPIIMTAKDEEKDILCIVQAQIKLLNEDVPPAECLVVLFG
jgi:hypothetical protein